MKNLLLTSLVLLTAFRLSAQSLSLDPDFGVRGTSLVNFYERTNDNYNAVAINVTDDNRVMLGGDIFYEAMSHLLRPDGKDDLSFGRKGFCFYEFGAKVNNRVVEILKYPGGKRVLIGQTTPCLSLEDKYNTDYAATVIRLLPDGTPDPGFGINGRAISIFRDYGFWAFTGLVQPDGKIVVAGRAKDNPSVNVWEKVVVMRFTADGQMDLSFGRNGQFVIPQYTGFNTLFFGGKMSIALQPDGKIILGDIATETISIGASSATQASPAVYRINPGGAMDSTFGVNGMFLNRLGFYNYDINGVMVQDGKIVVSGNLVEYGTGISSGWLLYRLDSTGKLDTSFAGHGIFTHTAASAGWRLASAGDIAPAASGGILVSAVHAVATGGVLDVFRLKTNGSFDSSFAQGAVIYQQPMVQNFYFDYSKLAVDSSGELAVLGYSGIFPTFNFNNIGHMVLRLSGDGIPIKTFNGTGYKQDYNTRNLNQDQISFGSTDLLAGMVRLSSGRILLAAHIITDNERTRECGLVALTPKGSVDSSFGANGRLKPLVTSFIDHVRVFYRMDDDKILMSKGDSILFKIDSTGSIDPTFGTGGFVNLHTGTMQLTDVIEQPDKKILVLSAAALSRLNADGSPDPGFATNGTLQLHRPFYVFGYKIRLQQDGSIVLAVNSIGPGNQVYLFRCSSSGLPDISFGSAGDGYALVNVNIPTAFEWPYLNVFKDFQILPDGKIVVLSMRDRTGTIDNPGGAARYDSVISRGAHFRDFMLFRLLPGGNIDSSFGGYPIPSVYKGTAHLQMPYVESIPSTLNVDTSTGDLILSGYFNKGTGWDAGIMRVHANGIYDTTCAVKGVATLGQDNLIQQRFFSQDLALYMQPLPNGSYLMAGTQEGQGPDLFVRNILLSPNTPAADYSSLDAVKDTACLKTDLSWQTSYECGLDSFVVEYSRDGVSFSRIGSVKALGNPPGKYDLAPLNAAYGPNYYRLRLYDGGNVYGASDVKEVDFDGAVVAHIVWATTLENKRDSVFDVTLQWITTQEDHAGSFRIQESLDSLNFTTVGTVPSDGTPGNYSFIVKGLDPGKYYFRVQAEGSDCRQTSGPLTTVSLKGCADTFKAYPSPVHGLLTVETPACEIGDVRVVDVPGRILQIIKHPPSKFTIDFSRYAAAPYFVQFLGKDKYVIKILKL